MTITGRYPRVRPWQQHYSTWSQFTSPSSFLVSLQTNGGVLKWDYPLHHPSHGWPWLRIETHGDLGIPGLLGSNSPPGFWRCQPQLGLIPDSWDLPKLWGLLPDARLTTWWTNPEIMGKNSERKCFNHFLWSKWCGCNRPSTKKFAQDQGHWDPGFCRSWPPGPEESASQVWLERFLINPSW